jgi:hypothetical protein
MFIDLAGNLNTVLATGVTMFTNVDFKGDTVKIILLCSITPLTNDILLKISLTINSRYSFESTI